MKQAIIVTIFIVVTVMTTWFVYEGSRFAKGVLEDAERRRKFWREDSVLVVSADSFFFVPTDSVPFMMADTTNINR